MAGTDFSHLTDDELIKGIQALKLPDYIRSKAHGIDVRETLAQMTEMTIQLGVNMGLSPEESLKWARKLQESVSQSEFDSWVATLLDGGPSLFFETKAALVAEHPTGAPGVALVRETDPAKIYVWNGTTWEDFGDYQGIEVKDGTVTTGKIADNAVTPKKTTFAKKGKNLFEGSFIANVVLLGPTKGIYTLSEEPGGYSAIVEVEPNKTYCVSKRKDSSNRFMIAETSEYPEVGTKFDTLLNVTSFTSDVKIETSPNTKYIIVYLSSPTENKIPEEFQVEEKSYKTTYESPNKVKLDLVPRSVDVHALKNITPTGILTGGHSNFNVDLANKKITTIGMGGFVNSGGDKYYLSDGEWSYSGLTTQSIVVAFDTSNREIVFYTILDDSDKEEYRNLPILGIIRRDKNTATFYGNYQINGKSVVPYTGGASEGSSSESLFYIDDVLHGTYEPTESPYISPWESNVESVYSIYDDLVTRYPSYVSRKLWGNDSSGLPIYQYDFKAGNVKEGSTQQSLPKIVVSNTHSFERPALVGASKFWTDLCDNWKTNELLRTLRWNVHFIVIPILNPYGLNNVQRPNFNGVDLARNFSAGWNQDGENGNPDGVTYAGTEPLSQIETQLFDQFMEANKDAVFAIDVHNYTTLRVSDSVLWLGSSVPDTQKLIQGYAQKMSSYAQEKYIYGIVEGYENESLGLIVKTVNGGSTTSQWESKGVNSTILELVSDFSTTNQDVQEFTCAALGNLILTALRELI